MFVCAQIVRKFIRPSAHARMHAVTTSCRIDGFSICAFNQLVDSRAREQFEKWNRIAA